LANPAKRLESVALGAAIAARAGLGGPGLAVLLASAVLASAATVLAYSLAAAEAVELVQPPPGPVPGGGEACPATIRGPAGSTRAWAVDASTWRGPAPRGAGEVVLGEHLARLVGARDGGVVAVEAPGASGEYRVRVLRSSGPSGLLAILPSCDGTPLLDWGRLSPGEVAAAIGDSLAPPAEALVALSLASHAAAGTAAARAAAARLAPSLSSASYEARRAWLRLGYAMVFAVYAAAGAGAALLAVSAAAGLVSSLYIPPPPMAAASLPAAALLAVVEAYVSARW